MTLFCFFFRKTEISQGNVRICQQRGKKLVVKSRRNSLKFFHRQSKMTPEIFSVTLQNYVSNPKKLFYEIFLVFFAYKLGHFIVDTAVFRLRQKTLKPSVQNRKTSKKPSSVGLTCIFLHCSKCITFLK